MDANLLRRNFRVRQRTENWFYDGGGERGGEVELFKSLILHFVWILLFVIMLGSVSDLNFGSSYRKRDEIISVDLQNPAKMNFSACLSDELEDSDELQKLW